MNRSIWIGLLAITMCSAAGAESSAGVLPPGMKAVWDLGKAYHEATPTRERICINGLWRWQPAEPNAQQVPTANWGYFKVPGCWPGITDYMQKDCQTVFAHPRWKGRRLRDLTAAWYERTVTVPDGWAGRRIAVNIEYLNSYAALYVDGVAAGECRFPGGTVDLTSLCCPGGTYRLSLLVVAMPLQGVMLSYTDSASARQVKGTVARRGLCGDVCLEGTPAGPHITDLRVDTSVRKKELTLDVAFEGLASDTRYALHARIMKDGRTVKEFTSPPGDRSMGVPPMSSTAVPAVNPADRIRVTEKWMPGDLWDIHTPQNQYDLEVSLVEVGGRVAGDKLLDTVWPVRFGFRELWIEGRDFYLNGTRIFLSAIPLDNAQVSAGLATYAAARESLQRLKSFGINFVYTHNYGCEPGAHLGFAEILRAADDVGMLVSFSQPHFSHYNWKDADADRNNGYARHAAFYVRAAQNHPAVVMYAMSHNATGYSEDMNPDLIDGIHDARDQWAQRNVKLALRAEAIVRSLDPSRIVYHHASGNLGSMHPVNFYPNFAPIQELSDWFEHWATEGVKPVFLCEYGAPFTWDWTMYRGWYQGQREFGSAAVPWEFCLAEWNAQFLGDPTFRISDAEKANLRWEAKQLQAGRVWHRWDYPVEVGSTRFDERYPIFARYLTDNWRAFRTWGVSAISPWECGHFWKLREGVDKRRRELAVDSDNLQQPGFSPDYVDQRYERMDLAYDRADWIATPAAQALIRNNGPLLAYIAGGPDRFTGKDHIFYPGETAEKQLVVINNSRQTVTCDYTVRAAVRRADPAATKATMHPIAEGKAVIVETGQQKRILLRVEISASPTPVRYDLFASVKFSTGQSQDDSFFLDVPLLPPNVQTKARIAVYDPQGQTGALLRKWQVPWHAVEAGGDLSAYDVLVIGKAALTVGGPAPDIRRVRDGLKVIVFEQRGDVLEKRLGFRVAEYGLRQVFPRVPDHPLLAGLLDAYLHDWRGAATILPPRLQYEIRPRYGPTVSWCGIPVTRLWRCGNQGNVASVLIEKPARGDLLPILDGGFALQYSPLLEYREGKGLILFCQMDVTGRTQRDPAADRLVRNVVEYVSAWKPARSEDVPSLPRQAVYVGEPAGKSYLDLLGVRVRSYEGDDLSPNEVLIIGPGGGPKLADRAARIADWIKTGGNTLAIGLDETDVGSWLPFEVTLKKAEHIAAYFEPFAMDLPFVGVGPAEVHNRDPRPSPLVSRVSQPRIEGGASSAQDGPAGGEPIQVVGDGVLAKIQRANVVFCQLAPWQFDGDQANLRRTRRHLSVLVSRLLANMGVASSAPLLDRFRQPVGDDRTAEGPIRGVPVAASRGAPQSIPATGLTAGQEKRWLNGLYLDQPQEWDDPYRFFRW